MSESLVQLWGAHMIGEFVTKNADEAVAMMTEDVYVLHVPVTTGARGRDEVRRFYAVDFIPHVPPDIAISPLSRTVGSDRLVDEMILSFTHTIEMPWFLPGVPLTGCPVKIPIVVIVGFRDGRISFERLYWDHASVLGQVGELEGSAEPEQARRVTEWASGVSARRT